MDDELDTLLMELIVYSGDARSSALEAVVAARKGNIGEAEIKLKAAEDSVTKAHQYQTQLMVRETEGKGLDISMIVIHSQDHLMNALTVIDLAREFIALWKERYAQK